ncbi:hypothetical protein DFH11DRAFT_912875 [Phellopilus nigrolimitatus]|nr:hypothetical protein DFH11DRAFT_912875 [Phellopilus nigrolimitatus]
MPTGSTGQLSSRSSKYPSRSSASVSSPTCPGATRTASALRLRVHVPDGPGTLCDRNRILSRSAGRWTLRVRAIRCRCSRTARHKAALVNSQSQSTLAHCTNQTQHASAIRTTAAASQNAFLDDHHTGHAQIQIQMLIPNPESNRREHERNQESRANRNRTRQYVRTPLQAQVGDCTLLDLRIPRYPP